MKISYQNSFSLISNAVKIKRSNVTKDTYLTKINIVKKAKLKCHVNHPPDVATVIVHGTGKHSSTQFRRVTVPRICSMIKTQDSVPENADLGKLYSRKRTQQRGSVSGYSPNNTNTLRQWRTI